MDEELERFKRIRLHEYAASLGYELDKQESSRRETVMRRNDEKISIRMDADGHYVYYSFRDPGDKRHDPRFRDERRKDHGRSAQSFESLVRG